MNVGTDMLNAPRFERSEPLDGEHKKQEIRHKPAQGKGFAEKLEASLVDQIKTDNQHLFEQVHQKGDALIETIHTDNYVGYKNSVDHLLSAFSNSEAVNKKYIKLEIWMQNNIQKRLETMEKALIQQTLDEREVRKNVFAINRLLDRILVY